MRTRRPGAVLADDRLVGHRVPDGHLSGGLLLRETDGVATCVLQGYLPGGTAAEPNHDTNCPPGSGLRVARLTGTLCTEDTAPYDVVAPVPPPSS